MEQIEKIIDQDIPHLDAPTSWIALKLMEDDPEIIKKIEETGKGQRVIREVKKSRDISTMFLMMMLMLPLPMPGMVS
ncbi:hypothetical protein [Methanobacterium petrolearium]|uniref:hypothetical protein n=1 Tax=Methanobacterium petrolearium TaxID=710190 RepID=UPI003081BDCA